MSGPCESMGWQKLGLRLLRVSLRRMKRFAGKTVTILALALTAPILSSVAVKEVF